MKNIYLKKTDITHYLIILYIFLAPYSVSGIFELFPTESLHIPIPTSVIIGILLAGYFFLKFLSQDKLIMEKDNKYFIIAFFLPVICSSLLSIYNLYMFVESSTYMQYLSLWFFTRLINLCIFFGIYIGISNYVLSADEVYNNRIMKAYLYSIMIMGFIGCWQWAHFYLDVPFINLETRSDIHSIGNNITSLLNSKRVTSIANEPSFLVPFLIDGILIGMAVIKSKIKYVFCIFLPLFFVLIFSYSFGGYLNIIIIFFAFLIVSKRFALISIIISIVCLILLALSYYTDIIDYILPFILRLENFDFENDIRFYMTMGPFKWIFEYTILNIIFGVGPGSYKFISLTKYLPDGNMVHETSNNMFSDVLYESGVFGFVLIILFFMWLLRSNYRIIKSKGTYIPFLLTLHLIITSFYRADYTAPRFLAVLIILLIMKKGLDKKELKI